MSDPLFVTTDLTKWGAGVGRALTAGEIDENFFALLARIIELEVNPPIPKSISNVVQVGNQLKVFLSDGSEFGPFTLPTARFAFRGEWANATQYYRYDVITVAGVGVFFVEQEHVSADAPAPFDPLAINGTGDALYFQVFGAASTGGGAVGDAYPAIEHALFGGI